MAIAVIIQSLLVWAWLLYFRAIVAHKMNISAWYALTTPLGAGVFAAMMLTSAWRSYQVKASRGVEENIIQIRIEIIKQNAGEHGKLHIHQHF